ncbi:MAG: hypothetical protein PF450_10820, partial [Bacteroidales bacterium]|nr:hypothetical protein [Bacteroidales bacterium]
VDQLTPANDVVLDVSLGLTADLPLTSSSTTININPGGNTADLTLAYNTYTIQGTLLNSAGTTALASQIIEVDGKNLTTDANGKFSFNLSTENWDSIYSKFFLDVSGEKYEFARTKKTLINSWSNFNLIAKPEFFVDMTILSDSFPIKGARVGVDNGAGYDYATVTADANGRLLYGPVDWTRNNEALTVNIDFKGVFVEHQFTTRGAPGAILGEVTLDPYVFVQTESVVGGTSPQRIYQIDFNDDAAVIVKSSKNMSDIVGIIDANIDKTTTDQNYNS